MTGQTTARAAGGAQVQLAYIVDSVGKTTVVFEPGMTWGDYIASKYVTQIDVAGRKTGFWEDPDNGWVQFYTGMGYRYVALQGSGIQSTDELIIEAAEYYTTA